MWTTIPKLLFTLRNRTSELTSDVASTRKSMDMNDLHQVLLLCQGPIHELTLAMHDYWEHYDRFEFDQIILLLSRNHTVKKLTLTGSDGYKLPISVFSLLQLTTLNLYGFDLDYPPTFDGFGSLESLYLNNFKWLVLDPVLQELPTSLIHLKYLCLEGMCIDEDYRLAFHILIKCSPNLERFELKVDNIQQILLLRQGPTYELTLQLPEDEDAGLELDQIVSQLPGNYPLVQTNYDFASFKFTVLPFVWFFPSLPNYDFAVSSNLQFCHGFCFFFRVKLLFCPQCKITVMASF
ncbi:putative leucine-rich repeat domain superfamily [Helianthus anomalus]